MSDISKLAKWGLLPDHDHRVITITRRWMETRSRVNTLVSESAAKDAEIKRLKARLAFWSEGREGED